MSNQAILTTTPRAEKSALDEFLPESVFTPDVRGRGDVDLYLAPNDVQLDAVEAVGQSPTPASSSSVQMWPMLAAALVAIGVSMLALAAFEKFGFSAL